MPHIILTTLNARYIHSALGLRYLMANMGTLQADTTIQEYNIDSRPIDIVEKLLSSNPVIIGFGVYIWNVEQITYVVALIKQIAPEIHIVIGGPEVSYEHEGQHLVQCADYVITGAADNAFAQLCQSILANNAPQKKIINAEFPPLPTLTLPYQFYTDEDIAQRIIYVEASRGCPFKCEFCLSALDKTAWPFDLDTFLQEMKTLYERGARHFKFVDRTFNLKVANSLRILAFFLERMDDTLFLHFELIPDHLPSALKEAIAHFPQGSLQFEVGIQSMNPGVQSLISRKQNNAQSEENLAWLRNASQAHIHADLIVGLPGEDMASFARGFNRLVTLNPHEIQVGILKRLRGTPLSRHTHSHKMKYNPFPPYNILSTDLIDFNTLQRFTRFARYWDMIANSGRFQHTTPLILDNDPFSRFMRLSDWLFKQTDQTHRIALRRLFELLHQGLRDELGISSDIATDVLWQDYQSAKLKGSPSFISPTKLINHKKNSSKIAQRQARHIG